MNPNPNENRRHPIRGERQLYRIEDDMLVAEVVYVDAAKSNEIQFTDDRPVEIGDSILVIGDPAVQPDIRSEPTVVEEIVVVEDTAVVEYLGENVGTRGESSGPKDGSVATFEIMSPASDAVGAEEFLEAHPTATRLAYTFFDKALLGMALMVGFVGGGLGALACFLTVEHVGNYASVGPAVGGAIGVAAGAMMSILMLNWYGKRIYNRKDDAWKRSHAVPKSWEGGLLLLLRPLLEPVVLIVFLIFMAVGGFVAMTAMSNLPLWLAIGLVWFGVPSIGCILGLTLISGFEER